MFCAECGLQLAKTAKYCSGCGSSIAVVDPNNVNDARNQSSPNQQTYKSSEQIRMHAGKSSAEFVYLMYALTFLLALPALIGIFVAYGKVGDYKGTYLESHFRWQIHTFWGYLALGLIMLTMIFYPMELTGLAILSKIGIAIVMGLVMIIWLIYRIVKGWMSLSDLRPVS